MRTFIFGSLLVSVLSGGLLLGGCFSNEGGVPCEGALGCACYPNSAGNPGLCETPLVCVVSANTNVCRAPTDASTASLPEASTSSDATLDGVGPSLEASKGMDATPTGDATQPTPESGANATNLITNGNFSMGQTGWAIVGGTGTITTPAGQLCVAVASGQMAVLGWPEPTGTPGLALVDGASYTLSYSAMATPAVTVDAKVGHTTTPFTADFETAAGSDAVTSSFTSFVHPFTAPTNPETSAGIAFMIPQMGMASNAEMVCFESVSLVQN
jgi:hypothetical protein